MFLGGRGGREGGRGREGEGGGGRDWQGRKGLAGVGGDQDLQKSGKVTCKDSLKNATRKSIYWAQLKFTFAPRDPVMNVDSFRSMTGDALSSQVIHCIIPA